MPENIKLCHVCRKTITTRHDLNYVDSDSKKLNPRDEIENMCLKINNSSPFIWNMQKPPSNKKSRHSLDATNEKLNTIINKDQNIINESPKQNSHPDTK